MSAAAAAAVRTQAARGFVKNEEIESWPASVGWFGLAKVGGWRVSTGGADLERRDLDREGVELACDAPPVARVHCAAAQVAWTFFLLWQEKRKFAEISKASELLF